MDNFFIILILIMLIFLVSIFLFVYFTSVGVEKDVGDLKTELERARAPSFSPMGIFVRFMEFFLSFFKTK